MRLIDADELKKKCLSNLGAPLWLIDEMPTIEQKAYNDGYYDGYRDGAYGKAYKITDEVEE